MRSTSYKITITVILLISFVAIQCSDSPNEPEPDYRTLSLSTYDWEAPVAGGSSPVINITDSSGTGAFKWYATVEYYGDGVWDGDWLTLSADSGTTPGELTLTVTPQKRFYYRTARVIITPSDIADDPDTIEVVQEVMFAPPVNYTVGNTPVDIVPADLDGDGYLDLAVANDASNNVSVLLSNGDGSFQGATNFEVGERPWSIAPAELNGDGYIDLVTADASSGNFSLLFNSQAGGFGAAVSYAVEDIRSIVAADFDDDGDGDLAVMANQAGAFQLRDCVVSVWSNDGAGVFESTGELFGDSILAAASADLDGDGDTDLATMRYSFYGEIQVLANDGSGKFLSAPAYSLDNTPESICVSDLDNDGDVDIIASNGWYCSVMHNNGDGSFQEAHDYLAEIGIDGVSAGDFDCDGYNDMVVADYSHDCVIVWLNLGDGTFGNYNDRNYYSVGDVPVFTLGSRGATDSPKSVCAGDFDGDGDCDLAVTNNQSGTVSVLINNWVQ